MEVVISYATCWFFKEKRHKTDHVKNIENFKKQFLELIY